MKHLILTLIASLVTANANAEVLKAQLTKFNMQEPSLMFIEPVGTGSVEVDTAAKTITLRVGARYHQVVPLLETIQGGCNETIYKGHEGTVIADGFHTAVTVTDYSTTVCDMVIENLTQVELNISGGFAGIMERHLLAGEQLVSNDLVAHLDRLNFQPGSALANENISYASVQVDTANQKIILALQPAMNCRRLICPAMMPAQIYITLPLGQVITERNGTIRYVSKSEVPAEGGPIATLTVYDYSSAGHIRPAAAVVVTLSFRAFIPETHTLFGQRI